MRRIAICFSGHLRNFLTDTVSNDLVQFNNFVKGIEEHRKQGDQVDLFFSLWETHNAQTARYRHNIDSRLVDKELLSFLKPVEVEIEIFGDMSPMFNLRNFSSDYDLDGLIYNSAGYFHSTPMYYKIYRANLLKKQHEEKNGFKYDAVVRYRSNIQLEAPLHIGEVLPNTLCVRGSAFPNRRYEHFIPGEKVRQFGHTHDSDILQDIFFYGDSETMDKVCDLYNNFSHILKNHGLSDPERMLYDWCVYDCELDIEKNPNKFKYRVTV
jgi:hypothetical protein